MVEELVTDDFKEKVQKLPILDVHAGVDQDVAKTKRTVAEDCPLVEELITDDFKGVGVPKVPNPALDGAKGTRLRALTAGRGRGLPHD